MAMRARLADGHRRASPLGCARPFQVLRPSGPFAALDRYRAWRPSVIQDADARLRMWYAGHDGTASRVLAAEQRPGRGWERLGPSVVPGFSGRTDSVGVDAPSVAHTAAGYLMAYAGSNGRAKRIHLATSTDGYQWHPSGPCRLPGGHDQTAPCLIALPGAIWLYYVGTGGNSLTSLFAATSRDGVSWRDAGLVMDSESTGDVLQPWVVARSSGVVMFFLGAGAGDRGSVRMATSSDGRMWSRQGAVTDLAKRHHDAGFIDGPTALISASGNVRLWYAAGDEDDASGACRLWSTELIGRLP
jgi:predicted GH43/DUF377 family glycosyl hydrolase